MAWGGPAPFVRRLFLEQEILLSERSNEEWIVALGQSGPQQDAALEDLRAVLVRGLSYALADWPKVKDSDLQDFAQDALLRILKGLHTFRGESRFTTWANKIAVRVAFTELRRRRWRDVSLNELMESEEGDTDFIPRELSDPSIGPEQQVMQRAILDRLRQLIGEELTDKQRQAMQAGLRGMPLQEIADRMDTNRNALYKLLYDARRRLQARLLDEGLSAQEVLSAFELQAG